MKNSVVSDPKILTKLYTATASEINDQLYLKPHKKCHVKISQLQKSHLQISTITKYYYSTTVLLFYTITSPDIIT